MFPILLLATMAVATPTLDFDAWFTGQTLRLDLYHSGTATEEHLSLDEVRREGEWPGSRTRLLDDTGMGKYRFVVRDLQTQTTLYTRGFASIYGEWETIGEARRGVWRSFHESYRFPEPLRPVQLVIEKRGADDSFSPIYSGVCDPSSRFVNRAPLSDAGEVWSVFRSGSPSTKVDLLVLGDGYAAGEQEKYRADVRRMVAALFDTEPFQSRKGDFNVWGIDVVSTDSGITNPRADSWKRTPLGLSFNAFDSERYVLTYANRELREIAANAPYDALMILGNTRKYGGGGIYGLWATVASDTAPAEYVFVHEFGHSFGGLADEYYTSEVSYEEFVAPGTEPWEPNVTALLDPSALKWGDLVADGTPLPTPWDQARYDEASYEYQEKRNALRAAGAPDSEVEELFAEVKAITEPMLRSEEYFGKVGAFEGGAYQAKGIYRPEVDCIMFTRNPKDFCRVCARGLEGVIDLYSK